MTTTTTKTFSVIEDGQTHRVEASLVGGAIRISPAALKASLGWELKPKGLCRGEVCVPTAQHATLIDDDGVS